MHVTSSEPLVNTSTACQVHSRTSSAHKRGEQPGPNDPVLKFQGLSVSIRKEENSTPQVTHTAQLNNLPYEIVCHIAERLDARSIAALSQTDSYLRDAVHGMAIDKIASQYYGPPGSASRRQHDRLYTPLASASEDGGYSRPHDRLYTPLARRLWPATGLNNDTEPLPEEQQIKQRLHQITRLRTLSQSGKLSPTCNTFEEKGSFTIKACGSSKPWGACALISTSVAVRELYDYRELLFIVAVDPTPTLIPVPPIEQPPFHYVGSAKILPGGHIVTASRNTLPYRQSQQHILTVCRQNRSGEIEQVVLPGSHSGEIVRFEQLADGRIVSASHDCTLKIRPLQGLDEKSVITLTGHLDRITDMLLLSDSRCITSSIDHTLKIWDLGQPSKESCVTTLTDFPRIVDTLHALGEHHFLSGSGMEVLLLWKLTDSGATCTTMIDPDWYEMPLDGQRTGREPPYELPADPIPHSSIQVFKPQALPDGRIAVQHGADLRLCDPTALHREPKRVCIVHRDSHGAVGRTLPICPIGARLIPRIPPGQLVSLLPDGRAVRIDHDGNINLHNLGNPDPTSTAQPGSLFSDGPLKASDKRRRRIQCVKIMDDGRLFASTEMVDQKTRFFVYDPYAPAKGSHNPAKED